MRIYSPSRFVYAEAAIQLKQIIDFSNLEFVFEILQRQS